MAGAKQLAKAETIDLWFMDESGFATIPNVQRSWSPLGKPHVADAGTYRKRVNVLGALNYRTGMLEYDLHSGSVKEAEVEKFIQRLAQQSDPNRITLVVLDNARIHHAIEQEKLDEWMCRYGLCLCFLPTILCYISLGSLRLNTYFWYQRNGEIFPNVSIKGFCRIVQCRPQRPALKGTWPFGRSAFR